MINSVSGISFRRDAAVNASDLINSPGKFTLPAAPAEVPADSFEKAEGQKKKSHTGAIIGTIVGLLAAAYIGLGIAVHKGGLTKIDNPEGIMQKAKNFFHSIGESADNLWGKIRGKKAEGASNTNTQELASEVPAAE